MNIASIQQGSGCYYVAEDVLEQMPEFFFHCNSNLQIERDLESAGVLEVAPQTSGGRMYIEFSSYDHAYLFIQRFNSYIERMNILVK